MVFVTFSNLSNAQRTAVVKTRTASKISIGTSYSTVGLHVGLGLPAQIKRRTISGSCRLIGGMRGVLRFSTV